MCEDVVLELPGSSPFAGEHRGHESVEKFLLGIRQFIISEEASFTFVHDANSLIAFHQINVAGPTNVVEMTLRLTIDFDREERISTMKCEPSDPGLFTHVIAAAFSMASSASSGVESREGYAEDPSSPLPSVYLFICFRRAVRAGQDSNLRPED